MLCSAAEQNTMLEQAYMQIPPYKLFFFLSK